MLVHRPRRQLLKYKGYDICIHSTDVLEDLNKFDAIALEARLLIEHAIQEVYKFESSK